MKICCISDLHGNLPELDSSDLLIIAGDICPNKYGTRNRNLDADFQYNWCNQIFLPWLSNVKAKTKVVCWGNHDFVGEGYRLPFVTDNCETIVLSNSVKIWCTPYSLEFYNWAFNCDEETLSRFTETIPQDVDIIVSHGPPKGFGDKTLRGERVGSIAMYDAIIKYKPKLFVTAHIHEDYGLFQYHGTTIVNASLLDLSYSLVNQPIYLNMDF